MCSKSEVVYKDELKTIDKFVDDVSMSHASTEQKTEEHVCLACPKKPVHVQY